MNEVTEEQLQKVIEDMMVKNEMVGGTPFYWCHPIGDGLYQTGNCIHGEAFADDLNKALREEHKKMAQ